MKYLDLGRNFMSEWNCDWEKFERLRDRFYCKNASDFTEPHISPGGRVASWGKGTVFGIEENELEFENNILRNITGKVESSICSIYKACEQHPDHFATRLSIYRDECCYSEWYMCDNCYEYYFED